MNTFMAKGVISDKSERHLQTIGMKEQSCPHRLERTDLVIAIGYDLVEYSPKNWNRNLKTRKLFILILLHAEVETYYPPDN